MGQVSDEEYTTKFLELLKYVPYLKDEKVEIKWYISGLPLAFKDQIEFEYPWTLEYVIKKLKHYYE